jgi:hypothetical protein
MELSTSIVNPLGSRPGTQPARSLIASQLHLRLSTRSSRPSLEPAVWSGFEGRPRVASPVGDSSYSCFQLRNYPCSVIPGPLLHADKNLPPWRHVRSRTAKHDDSSLYRYLLYRSGPDGLRGPCRFRPWHEPNVWFRRFRPRSGLAENRLLLNLRGSSSIRVIGVWLDGRDGPAPIAALGTQDLEIGSERPFGFSHHATSASLPQPSSQTPITRIEAEPISYSVTIGRRSICRISMTATSSQRASLGACDGRVRSRSLLDSTTRHRT